MSSQVLELGTIKLDDLTEKLTLVAIATAELGIEDSLYQLPSRWTKDTLESGNIWVTRAAGLSLEVEILFNGNPIDKNWRMSLLESVGNHITNAKFWLPLCLSTGVEFPRGSSKSQLSLKINESAVSLGSSPESWPGNIDHNTAQNVGQPPVIFCAKLEKIYLQCNISLKPTTKRRRTEPLPRSPPDVMLLDHRAKSTLGKTTTVEELDHDLLLQLPNTSKGDADNSQLSHPIDRDTTQIPQTRPRGKRFPKHISNILKDWVTANVGKARPDMHDKGILIKQTGLQWKQIYLSIRYYMEREHKVRLRDENDMLIGNDTSGSIGTPRRSATLLADVQVVPDDNEMLLLEETPEFDNFDVGSDGDFDEDNDMLFNIGVTSSYNVSRDAPLSPPVTEASLSQPSEADNRSVPPFKRLASGTHGFRSRRNLVQGDLAATSSLIDVALRTLIGGDVYCQPKHIILDKKENLDIPLQSISPTLFSIGFKGAMTRNSKFVPFISRSISTSISYHAQSPALRQKLSELSTTAGPTTMPPLANTSSNHGPSLCAIIQSRLWAMMQRAHFDSSRARRLLRVETEIDLANENVDFEDLLSEQMGIDDAGGSDSESDFDDLLDDEDGEDGFLSYLDEAEQERLSIEREIEVMLLGHKQDEDDDSLLFSDAIEEEDSLLL